jgi:flagellar protein FlaG
MLIQNTSSAASASGHTSDSAPVAAAAPHTKTVPVELPQVAVKAAVDPHAAPPTPAQLQTAVDNINKAMRQNNSNVEFSIDTDTKQTVIKVVESKTGDVIRQFPSEDVMAIAREIDHVQQGLLVKQKA